MRIIAHCMHEQELDDAQRILPAGIRTDGYVLGDATDEQVQELERLGIVIQDLAVPSRVDGVRGARPVSAFAAASLATVETEPAPLDANGQSNYFVSLDGPLLEAWRTQLEADGARLQTHVEGKGYVARLAPSQANRLAALPFVVSVSPFDALATLTDGVPIPDPQGEGEVNSGIIQMRPFTLLMHEDANPNDFLSVLRDRQIPVAGVGGRMIRIYLSDTSDALAGLAAHPDVQQVESYVEPSWHNECGRRLMGVDNSGGIRIRVGGVSLEGRNEIVAIADSGLDPDHPDFPAARIVGLVDRGRRGRTDDPSGHGTHVAGSVLGDGTASSGAYQGVAPGAKLFFQSVMDSNGDLGGLPVDLGLLFQEAYDAGARIHNDSWGSSTKSAYTLQSNAVDDYVFRHKDMLIVISAGNDGISNTNLQAGVGFVDWLSIGSPASCKNALTVGASRSDRTTGPGGTATWIDWWPKNFPNPPISTDRVAGDPNGIAAFSSRGPCDTFRMKPDVVAPGTDILSCRSRIAPASKFWGTHSNPNYAYKGGTSMAAPLVSGAAALVREYYRTHEGHSPSAALLKATIINGTRVLSGTDALADYPGQPNYHQGFGAVDLTQSIPNDDAPGLKLVYEDTAPIFYVTGYPMRYRIRVDRANVPAEERYPLRICMAYTDPAGNGIQNNLNLLVQPPGSNRKHVGNEQVPPFGSQTPDALNNVEIVRIEDPADGDYLIQITATNILKPGQDFALVVTGNLAGPLRTA